MTPTILTGIFAVTSLLVVPSTAGDKDVPDYVLTSSLYAPPVTGLLVTEAPPGLQQVPVFSNESQPVYAFGTKNRQFIIGMLSMSDLAAELTGPADVWNDVAISPVMWSSASNGRVWRYSQMPPYLLDYRRATVVALDTPSGDVLVCHIGGEFRCPSSSSISTFPGVMCTIDFGSRWRSQPSLKVAVAAASMVVTPFGPLLIGGRVRRQPCSGSPDPDVDAASYAGVQRLVWSADGKSIQDWELLAYKIPLEATLFPSLAWSNERMSLYVAAGRDLEGSPRASMWQLPFFPPMDRYLDNITALQARLVDGDAWIQAPRLPMPITAANEQTVVLMEVLSDGHGFVDYLPEFIEPDLRPMWKPAEPLLPALALVSSGRVYLSDSYGNLGWNVLKQTVWPSPASANELLYKRGVVPMYVIYSVAPSEDYLHDLPYTLALGGVGLSLPSSNRTELAGQWVVTYPMIPCQPAPCRLHEGVWSAGCLSSPFDAPCRSCSLAPQCRDGEQLEEVECGTAWSTLGFPSAPICKPCTRCEDGDQVLVPCAGGKNDTVCGRKQNGGFKAVSFKLSIVTVALVFTFCGCMVLLALVCSCVRCRGGRTGRALWQRAGHLCACCAGVETPSKATQDIALVSTSASLNAAVRVLHLALSWCISTSALELVRAPPYLGPLLAAPAILAMAGQLLFCAWAAATIGCIAFVQALHDMAGKRPAITLFMLLGSASQPRTCLLAILAVMRAGEEQREGAMQGRSALQVSLLWNRMCLFSCDFTAAAVCIAVTATYVLRPGQEESAEDDRVVVASVQALAASAAVAHLVHLSFSIHVLQLAAMRQMIAKMSIGSAADGARTGADRGTEETDGKHCNSMRTGPSEGREVHATSVVPVLTLVSDSCTTAPSAYSARSSRVAALTASSTHVGTHAADTVGVTNALHATSAAVNPPLLSSRGGAAEEVVRIVHRPSSLKTLPEVVHVGTCHSPQGHATLTPPVSEPRFAGSPNAPKVDLPSSGEGWSGSSEEGSSSASSADSSGESGPLGDRDLQLLAGILAQQLASAEMESADVETRAEVQQALSRMHALKSIQ